MNLIIKQLNISNFKGISELQINFQGSCTTILGDNATGKTTVKDAFSWLLFGKDSLGNKVFGFQPVDEEGQVIHRLETYVEGVFDKNGEELKLKRLVKENWVTKRGETEATLQGLSYSLFINDLPTLVKKYDESINEICDYQLFKLITDPLEFNERLHWQDKRKMLLSICGDITDDDVFNSNIDLMELKQEKGSHSVDEFKSILDAKISPINTKLKNLPIQIVEATKAIPSTEDTMYNEDDKRMLQDRIDNLENEMSSITNGQIVKEVEIKIKDLQLQKKEFNNKVKNNKEFQEITKKIWELKNEASERKNLINQLELNNKSLEHRIQQCDDEGNRLLALWDANSEKVFTETTCAYCGQPLPSERLEELQAKFNKEKSDTFDRIDSQIAKVKEDKVNYQRELEINIMKTNEARQTLEHCESEQESLWQKRDDLEVEQHKLVADKEEEIQELINLEEAKKEKYILDCEGQKEEINNKIYGLKKELEVFEDKDALKRVIERQTQRVEELKQEQANLSSEYGRLTSLKQLCEQFIISKIELLNLKINDNFKLAKFKLFDKQFNGAIVETCETTYNGVAYKDLNNAMKINIGLDIINTLCEKNECNAPIFIDNAESVVELLETDSQVVKLKVSEGTKKLEII